MIYPDLLNEIKTKVKNGQYIISEHAQVERLEENIDVEEIEEAILNGEILEDYPEDRRGHSCLILCYSGKKVIHTICGVKQNKVVIITVYLPKLPKWITPKQRAGGTKNAE
ncbi:MAG: DUF4258 domain-containing protein [Elusimicrobiota bacterium]